MWIAMELSCVATLTRPDSPSTMLEERTITSAASPIQVLFVEDDAETAGLVHIHLSEDRDGEFHVEWTPNLVEAVIRLAQPGIDVVLLDLGLPELSGYKSYRVIEAAARHKLPVVIFTSDDRTVSKDLTLGLGAADYLLKHESSPAQLKLALRNAVLRGRPEH
jgi:DNA-binding response OmpR family regulator